MKNKNYMVYETITGDKIFHENYENALEDYKKCLDLIEKECLGECYLFKIEKYQEGIK